MSVLRRFGLPMRAYLITTGAVFGLITLAHIARAFAEGWHLASDPVFVLLTLAAAALCLWAWRLLRRRSTS
jgi:hypothetical protein